MSNIITPGTINEIFGTDENDLIFGTKRDDYIWALKGDDTLVGSWGNDTLDGGDGFDTADYNLASIEPITLLPTGIVSKGKKGTDQLINIERVVGAVGQANAIDASTATGSTSIDVNLTKNNLTVNNIPSIGSLNFTVENFVNVTGTNNSDSIVGNFADNLLNGGFGSDFLVGSSGNDTLIGSAGNDTLNGTDADSRGNGEVDTLQASGMDNFRLGDSKGAYYKFAGDKDFAQITNFNPNKGDVITVGIGDVVIPVADPLGFDIFVVAGGVKDLIADVLTDSSSDFTLPTNAFQLASGQTLGFFIGA